jgi:glycosyltransferase involved in cell wall biosynthesis
MRVAAITTSYPKHPQDGTAPFIRAITLGVAHLGATIDLVLPHHRELRWSEADGPVRLHRYRYAPSWSVLERWGYAGGLAADRRLHPAAVAVAPLAALAATHLLGRVVRQARPEVVHAHWLVPNGAIAAPVARRHGLPLVVSLHGSDVFLAERSRWLHRTVRRTLGAARAVTACSRDLAERAVALGARPDCLRVIPYGVDLTTFSPPDAVTRTAARRAVGIGEHEPVVLAVGRLVSKKGFDVLLEAVPRMKSSPSPVIVLAGDGDLRGRLAALAVRHAVDVRMPGPVDRPTLRNLYAAADVLVVPSVVDDLGNVDGLPNVALEGMAAGLALVASRVGGLPDVLTDRETARLVPPGDAGALASALDELLGDRSLRGRLGAAARARAERQLGWDTTCSRYYETLRGAVDE